MRDIRLGRTQPSWRAVNRFVRALRGYGFFPSVHFAERLLARAAERGARLSPQAFAQAFRRATRYGDVRPGYRNRVARVCGFPVVYRQSGPRGEHTRLVTVLPPEAATPYLRHLPRVRRH